MVCLQTKAYKKVSKRFLLAYFSCETEIAWEFVFVCYHQLHRFQSWIEWISQRSDQTLGVWPLACDFD